jgi:hypothetical protein
MTLPSVRIGGASGFWGDSQTAVPQLLGAGKVQFIVFDYLAEMTMSLLAAARAKQPETGYAGDFVTQLRPHLAVAMRQGVKLVSNAGGVNPAGCAAALAQLAAELGLSPRIAVVEGDDVLPLTESLRAEGVREMQTGEPLPPRLATSSAYLGALPIRAALDAGADIVVTGRCVDSAVTLGVLMHVFDWRADEHDKLAMGSLAGHIIECGCQATGGLHTDWRDVPDWAGIGYPVIEVVPEGSFVVGKPDGTGGLVSVPVVAEQMLYEVGDPARYILPDVVCDFSGVRLEQVGENRVAVRGAQGLPPTDTYKVCATYPEGFRATATLTIVGFEAVAKCERTAAAILERTRRLFREAGFADYGDTLVEVLGAEAGYGPHASGAPLREAVLRLAVAHPDRRALELFAREVAPAGTSWSTGTTGVGGRASPSRVLKQFSFLLAKTRVPVRVVIDGETIPIAIPAGQALAPHDRVDVADTPAAPHDADLVTVPLIALAWARSGDKGDSCNVGVIARTPALVEVLRRALTAERVRAYLAHLVKGKVTRFDVPGIGAFNFLLEEALGGGGMASLRNDPWGKGMAQILLAMPMRVPADLVPPKAQPSLGAKSPQ